MDSFEVAHPTVERETTHRKTLKSQKKTSSNGDLSNFQVHVLKYLCAYSYPCNSMELSGGAVALLISLTDSMAALAQQKCPQYYVKRKKYKILF